MAKGFTPIIGLAVVVALAMAAVFGAMSLTNPAFAAIGQPADAQLTERAVSPQVTTLEVDVYLGEALTYDLIPHLDGREDDVTKIDIDPAAGTPINVATFEEVDSRRDVGIEITPTATVLTGDITTTTRVTVTLGEGDDADEMVFFLQVTLNAITPAETTDETQGTVTVPDAGAAEAIGKPVFLKVDQLFVEGKGEDTNGDDGKIVNYTPTSSNGTDVVVGEVVVTGGGATFSIAPTNLSALDTYLDNMYVDTDATPPVDVSAAGRSAEIEDFIDQDIDDYGADGPTGYIVLYAPAAAEENDFSTVSVAGVDGLTGEDDPSKSFLTIVGPATAPGEVTEIIKADRGDLPLFEPGSKSPGSSTSYKVTFEADDAVNTRQSDLEIEFDGDYGMPSTIRNTSVAITTEGGDYPASVAGSANVNSRTFTPEDVTVDGETVLISLGDMDEA